MTPSLPKTQARASNDCLDPQLRRGWGDKWSSSRECRFTSYSLKAHLHRFHHHTGLNWVLHGPPVFTNQPTGLQITYQSNTKTDLHSKFPFTLKPLPLPCLWAPATWLHTESRVLQKKNIVVQILNVVVSFFFYNNTLGLLINLLVIKL